MASDGTETWEDFLGCTDLRVRKLRYLWTICNFSFCARATGKRLKSPIFGPVEGPQWKLSLYPNGVKEEVDDHISLYLAVSYKDKENKKPTTLKYKFAFLNSKLEPIYDDPEVTSIPYDISCFENGHGYDKLILRDKVMGLIKDDDELNIRCELTIFDGGEYESSGQPDHVSISPEPKCTLSEDMGSIFKDQQFGDTIIQVADKEFLVYGAILQIRSPVFAAMFQHELQEKKQNRVVITDAEPDVIEEVLTYIYTGKSPNIEAMADDLLPIAEKYSLKQLKIMSENVMSELLIRENAIETLILADLYRAKRLRKNVIDFIVAESSYFLGDEVWEKLQSSLSKTPDVLMEVVKALCMSIK